MDSYRGIYTGWWVYKKFVVGDELQMFAGTIVSINAPELDEPATAEPWYHVRYLDGDEEDMTFEELTEPGTLVICPDTLTFFGGDF